MEEKIFLGRGQQMLEVPQATWKEHLARVPQPSQSRLRFMTEAHHQVRSFVVKELVDQQKPVEAGFISKALNIPLAQVTELLEELEQKLFFLVKDRQGAVIWAYPVTVETTPHKLSFSSGEKLYGA